MTTKERVKGGVRTGEKVNDHSRLIAAAVKRRRRKVLRLEKMEPDGEERYGERDAEVDDEQGRQLRRVRDVEGQVLK
jgi:hypothetical protein